MDCYIDQIDVFENGEANEPIACNIPFDTIPLGQLPLGMAYVPMQKWATTYDAERALERGTIFPDLDLPWAEGRGV